MKQVVVTGSFDDIRSQDMRFLEEASKFGRVHVLLYSDEMVIAQTGKAPKFSEAERLYLIDAIRYADQVTLIPGHFAADAIPPVAGFKPVCPKLFRAESRAIPAVSPLK